MTLRSSCASTEEGPKMRDHQAIMSLQHEASHAWSAPDVILYALGIGLPGDPLAPAELAFVCEGPQLKVMPTFPVVVGFDDDVLQEIGMDPVQVLHGEHAVTLHRPFPASGSVRARSRIVGGWDKGEGKGAVFVQEKVLIPEGEDSPIATVLTTVFARGNGGYGGPREGQPAPRAVPDRKPDVSVDVPTTPQQALLYRRSGDFNVLHCDPSVAAAAGFDRPILHGLCTYAMCCRAVLQAFCENDPVRVRHHAARFSAVVYPGDVLTVDMWRDGDAVSFECRVRARGVTVIRNGVTLLG
jgi:acyl dehydratase